MSQDTHEIVPIRLGVVGGARLAYRPAAGRGGTSEGTGPRFQEGMVGGVAHAE